MAGHELGKYRLVVHEHGKVSVLLNGVIEMFIFYFN